MRICMYVMYVCTYVCMYVHIYIYSQPWMGSSIPFVFCSEWTQPRTSKILLYSSLYIQYIYIYLCAYIYIYIYLCAYIYIYIHKNIYIYTYIYINIMCMFIGCKSNIGDPCPYELYILKPDLSATASELYLDKLYPTMS